jgi:hypothetical protein
MAKVRMVMVDLEGADETVKGAVMSALERMGVPVLQTAAPLATALEVAAPMVRRNCVPLLPEPAKRRAKASLPNGRGSEKAPKTDGRRKEPEDAALPAATVEAVLRKRAMTSAEVIRAIPGAKAANVYYRLAQMRAAGAVETRYDEADGEKKNFLVASA